MRGLQDSTDAGFAVGVCLSARLQVANDRYPAAYWLMVEGFKFQASVTAISPAALAVFQAGAGAPEIAFQTELGWTSDNRPFSRAISVRLASEI